MGSLAVRAGPDRFDAADHGIGGTNTCVIANGIVSMTEADCTDLICVHTKSIDARGGTIVCMPNRVVLEIVDPRGDGDTPDAVAG